MLRVMFIHLLLILDILLNPFRNIFHKLMRHNLLNPLPINLPLTSLLLPLINFLLFFIFFLPILPLDYLPSSPIFSLQLLALVDPIFPIRFLIAKLAQTARPAYLTRNSKLLGEKTIMAVLLRGQQLLGVFELADCVYGDCWGLALATLFRDF